MRRAIKYTPNSIILIKCKWATSFFVSKFATKTKNVFEVKNFPVSKQWIFSLKNYNLYEFNDFEPIFAFTIIYEYKYLQFHDNCVFCIIKSGPRRYKYWKISSCFRENLSIWQKIQSGMASRFETRKKYSLTHLAKRNYRNFHLRILRKTLPIKRYWRAEIYFIHSRYFLLNEQIY